jgi:endo-1,4-beta-mannosidase
MGQEISILSEVNPNSPVKLMRDVVKVREASFAKRFGGKTPKQATENVVKDIKKNIKVPDKKQWSDFLKEIAC